MGAEVGGHFVDFIENENRVYRAGLLHHLDDLAGERADIGAAMTANFGFIAHAAERHANEFAAGGVTDGHGERGLADARRPDETEDGAFGIFYELADGKEFENALFDLFQAVMLIVQNFFGGFDVADFFGTFFPGHSEQPIEIVAAHGGFRGHGRHQLEALEFLDSLLVDFLAHAGGVDFLF